MFIPSQRGEKVVQNTLHAPKGEEVTLAEGGRQVTLKGIPRFLQKKYGVDSDVKATYTTSEQTASGKCFIAKNRRGKKVCMDPSDFPKGSVRVEFEVEQAKPITKLPS